MIIFYVYNNYIGVLEGAFSGFSSSSKSFLKILLTDMWCYYCANVNEIKNLTYTGIVSCGVGVSCCSLFLLYSGVVLLSGVLE